jgi:CheY-like chemotaxis protein
VEITDDGLGGPDESAGTGLAGLGEPEALRAAVDRTRPDIVVTDVRMPPTSGPGHRSGDTS